MKKYSGVLERVKQIEEKFGIKYAKPEGKLYKSLKIIYTFFWIYTLVINVLFVVTRFYPENLVKDSSKDYNAIMVIIVMTIILIAGYILNNYKLYLSGGIASVVSIIFMLPFFANLTEDTLGFMGYKFSFYWRHLIPYFVMLILISWLTILAVRAERIINKRYIQVIENLFNIYSKNKIEDGDLSNEEWDEFLKNYDPITNKLYKNQFEGQIEDDKCEE